MDELLDDRCMDWNRKRYVPKNSSQSSKMGEVRKCPSCGDVVPTLHGVCPTCGHTFNLSKVDVESIEKLEKDCQVLSNIKHSGMPILLALNLVYAGLSVLLALMYIDDLGWAIFEIFFFGNLCLGWYFPYLANQDNEDTGKLSAGKLQNYTFTIRSKINSTKLVYANNKIVMARLESLEKYVDENLDARKKRSKMIIIAGAVIAIMLPIMGLLLGW